MQRVDRHEALRARTKAYASGAIRLYSDLQRRWRFDDPALILGKQLLRSGTSVAANHREAKYARSRADRIAKFQLIVQELEESTLWLELLDEHDLASQEQLRSLLDESHQLLAIFLASLTTLRNS